MENIKYKWQVYEDPKTLIEMIRIFDTDKVQWTSLWSDFQWWFKHEYPHEFHAYCHLDYDDEHDNSFLIPEELQKQDIDYILRDYIYELQKKNNKILIQ